MKSKRIPTVSVAVCAYNEEDNILVLIESILDQKPGRYILKEIRVISDGSTDKTVSLCRTIQKRYPILTIYAHNKRTGKSSHLNVLYKTVQTDYLVQTDADVIWTPDVLDSITKAFAKHTAGMLGGNPQPILGTSFVEKAVNLTTQAYIPLRSEIRNGSNVFSSDGRLLAFRKPWYSKINIPLTMIANDMFAYFYHISGGGTYQFVPQAIVYYRSPQTIQDQIRQNTRFIASRIRLEKYFDTSLLQREFYVPSGILQKNKIRLLLTHPVNAAFIYVLNLICAANAIKQESVLTGTWPIATTTKHHLRHMSKNI